MNSSDVVESKFDNFDGIKAYVCTSDFALSLTFSLLF